MTIDQAFDRTVTYYDDWMKKALPGYDNLFAVATEVTPFESDAPRTLRKLTMSRCGKKE